MARYVDGFVLPIPRKNLTRYLRLARIAARVWREHGKGVASFLRQSKAKPGETVVLAWIVMMETRDVSFDMKRMAYGGFRVLVDA